MVSFKRLDAGRSSEGQWDHGVGQQRRRTHQRNWIEWDQSDCIWIVSCKACTALNHAGLRRRAAQFFFVTTVFLLWTIHLRHSRHFRQRHIGHRNISLGGRCSLHWSKQQRQSNHSKKNALQGRDDAVFKHWPCLAAQSAHRQVTRLLTTGSSKNSQLSSLIITLIWIKVIGASPR